MRKFAVLVSAALVVTALPALGSSHIHTVEGSVQLMAPAHTGGCFFGISRNQAVLFGEEQFQGRWGFIFDVKKETWGKPFTLEVTGATVDADLDIGFYSAVGPGYPGPNPDSQAFETRELGGEKGKVPAKMTKAIVCMHDGFEAEFIYKAKTGLRLDRHHH